MKRILKALVIVASLSIIPVNTNNTTISAAEINGGSTLCRRSYTSSYFLGSSWQEYCSEVIGMAAYGGYITINYVGNSQGLHKYQGSGMIPYLGELD